MQRIGKGAALGTCGAFRGFVIGALLLIFVAGYFGTRTGAAPIVGERQASPPVAIQNLPADVMATGEITIAAQIDVRVPILAVYGPFWNSRRAVVYPLLATDAPAAHAAPADTVHGFLYVDAPLADAEILDMSSHIPAFRRVGAVGPLITVTGTATPPPVLYRHVAALLAREGRAMRDGAIGIAPSDGQAAPAPMAPARWIALALPVFGGLAGMANLVLQRRARAAIVAHDAPRRAADPGPPRTRKARTRLPALVAQSDLDPALSPQEGGFGVRLRAAWTGRNAPASDSGTRQKSGVTPGRRNSLMRSRSS